MSDESTIKIYLDPVINSQELKKQIIAVQNQIDNVDFKIDTDEAKKTIVDLDKAFNEFLKKISKTKIGNNDLKLFYSQIKEIKSRLEKFDIILDFNMNKSNKAGFIKQIDSEIKKQIDSANRKYNSTSTTLKKRSSELKDRDISTVRTGYTNKYSEQVKKVLSENIELHSLLTRNNLSQKSEYKDIDNPSTILTQASKTVNDLNTRIKKYNDDNPEKKPISQQNIDFKKILSDIYREKIQVSLSSLSPEKPLDLEKISNSTLDELNQRKELLLYTKSLLQGMKQFGLNPNGINVKFGEKSKQFSEASVNKYITSVEKEIGKINLNPNEEKQTDNAFNTSKDLIDSFNKLYETIAKLEESNSKLITSNENIAKKNQELLKNNESLKNANSELKSKSSENNEESENQSTPKHKVANKPSSSAPQNQGSATPNEKPVEFKNGIKGIPNPSQQKKINEFVELSKTDKFAEINVLVEEKKRVEKSLYSYEKQIKSLLKITNISEQLDVKDIGQVIELLNQLNVNQKNSVKQEESSKNLKTAKAEIAKLSAKLERTKDDTSKVSELEQQLSAAKANLANLQQEKKNAELAEKKILELQAQLAEYLEMAKIYSNLETKLKAGFNNAGDIAKNISQESNNPNVENNPSATPSNGNGKTPRRPRRKANAVNSTPNIGTSLPSTPNHSSSPQSDANIDIKLDLDKIKSDINEALKTVKIEKIDISKIKKEIEKLFDSLKVTNVDLSELKIEIDNLFKNIDFSDLKTELENSLDSVKINKFDITTALATLKKRINKTLDNVGEEKTDSNIKKPRKSRAKKDNSGKNSTTNSSWINPIVGEEFSNINSKDLFRQRVNEKIEQARFNSKIDPDWVNPVMDDSIKEEINEIAEELLKTKKELSNNNKIISFVKSDLQGIENKSKEIDIGVQDVINSVKKKQPVKNKTNGWSKSNSERDFVDGLSNNSEKPDTIPSLQKKADKLFPLLDSLEARSYTSGLRLEKINEDPSAFNNLSAEFRKAKEEAEFLSNKSSGGLGLEELKKRVEALSESIPVLYSKFQKLDNITRKIGSKDSTEKSVMSVNKARIALLAQIDKYQKDNNRAFSGINTSVFGKKNFTEDTNALKNILSNRNVISSQSDLEKVREEWVGLKREITDSGRATQTFGNRMKQAYAKYGGWALVTKSFMLLQNTIRGMYTNVLEVDIEMTNLKKVCNATDAEFSAFLNNAGSRAQVLGTKISSLVAATAEFARLGYNLSDSSILGEAATLYQNVAEGMDIQTSAQSLVSTMQGYKIAAKDVMTIVDDFNYVGNNFAISSQGVGEALQRSASSLYVAGNSLEESLAMVAASNEVVQDPETVGTAFKTISARVRGASAELQELGEDEESTTKSTATLRKEILALTGVDIMKDNNTFKSTYQMLQEIADVWGNLTDINKATVLEDLAGKRSNNVVSALLENFDTAKQVMGGLENAQGSAYRENEKYKQGLQGNLNALNNAFQSLSVKIMGSGLLKEGIQFVTKITNTVGNLIPKIQSLGDALKIVLDIYAGTRILRGKGLFNDAGIYKSAKNTIGKIKELFKNNGKTNFSSIKIIDEAEFNQQINLLKQGIKTSNGVLNEYYTQTGAKNASYKGYYKYTKEIKEAEDAMRRSTKAATAEQVASNVVGAETVVVQKMQSASTATLAISIKLLKKSVAGLKAVATMGLSLIADVALTYVAGKVIDVIDNLKNKTEESHKTLEDFDNEISNTRSKLDDIESALSGINEELSSANKRIQELKNKGPLSLVEQDELAKLQLSVQMLQEQQRIKKEEDHKSTRDVRNENNNKATTDFNESSADLHRNPYLLAAGITDNAGNISSDEANKIRQDYFNYNDNIDGTNDYMSFGMNLSANGVSKDLMDSYMSKLNEILNDNPEDTSDEDLAKKINNAFKLKEENYIQALLNSYTNENSSNSLKLTSLDRLKDFQIKYNEYLQNAKVTNDEISSGVLSNDFGSTPELQKVLSLYNQITDTINAKENTQKALADYLNSKNGYDLQKTFTELGSQGKLTDDVIKNAINGNKDITDIWTKFGVTESEVIQHIKSVYGDFVTYMTKELKESDTALSNFRTNQLPIVTENVSKLDSAILKMQKGDFLTLDEMLGLSDIDSGLLDKWKSSVGGFTLDLKDLTKTRTEYIEEQTSSLKENLSSLIDQYGVLTDNLSRLSSQLDNTKAESNSFYNPNNFSLPNSNILNSFSNEYKTLKESADECYSLIQKYSTQLLSLNQENLEVLQQTNTDYQTAGSTIQQYLSDQVTKLTDQKQNELDTQDNLIDKEQDKIDGYENEIKKHQDIIDNLNEEINIYNDENRLRQHKMDLLDQENEKYQNRIDAIEKANEETEKANALEEARQKLENAKKQRNVRVYNSLSGWSWQANPEDVSAAQKEYNDLKKESDLAKKEKPWQDKIDANNDKKKTLQAKNTANDNKVFDKETQIKKQESLQKPFQDKEKTANEKIDRYNKVKQDIEYKYKPLIKTLEDSSKSWQDAANKFSTSLNEKTTASILGKNWKKLATSKDAIQTYSDKLYANMSKTNSLMSPIQGTAGDIKTALDKYTAIVNKLKGKVSTDMENMPNLNKTLSDAFAKQISSSGFSDLTLTGDVNITINTTGVSTDTIAQSVHNALGKIFNR